MLGELAPRPGKDVSVCGDPHRDGLGQFKTHCSSLQGFFLQIAQKKVGPLL